MPGVYYQYLIYASWNNENWDLIVNRSDNTKDLPHEFIELDIPITARYVKIVNVRAPENTRFSLFGFRLFGRQFISPPDEPSNFTVSRHTDSRTVRLSWDPLPNAIGYNVRFGLSPTKLYHNYLVYDNHSIVINSLLSRADYWFSIDSFNEGGITTGTLVLNSTGPYVTAVYNQATGNLTVSDGSLSPAQVSEWQPIAQILSLGPSLVLSPATFASFPAVTTIHAELSGLTAIPESAFANATSLTTVLLPPSLESIEASAFANSANFTTLSLPTSLKNIGESAFANFGIRALVLPDALRALGPSAFRNCVHLENLSFGPNIQAWGAGAFAGTGRVTRLEFSGSDASNVDCDVLRDAFAPSVVIVAPQLAGEELCPRPDAGSDVGSTGLPGWAISVIVIVVIVIVLLAAIAVCRWRSRRGMPPDDVLLASGPSKNV
jgi:hypothetical protein